MSARSPHDTRPPRPPGSEAPRGLPGGLREVLAVPRGGPRRQPTLPPLSQVEHQQRLLDQALAALDRLMCALPERPPLSPMELRRQQARWTARAPAFCQGTARAMEQHPEMFGAVPFSGAAVRGSLELGGRMDLLLLRLEQCLPQLAEEIVCLRGDLMDSCHMALQHGEAGLQRPYLPTEERRLIQQVTGSVQRILASERPGSGDELLDLIMSDPMPLGEVSADELFNEAELLGLEAMVTRSEEELADALLRKLARKTDPDKGPRKPN